MFSKQNLSATIVAAVAMFLLGYLIWGMATMSFFEEHALSDVMKSDEEMSLLMIFLGNLAGAFAMSTLYGKWANGTHSAGGGLGFGTWIGIFVGLGMGLVMYGTSKMMDGTAHAVEAILDIVYYAVIGAVIALVYKATAGKQGS
ncbi:hypothetical protein [Robiginitalea sp. SC105]|uniref:hypothetical protein n=1 Tax=Robiginitalea sp. SC105 TaxID=2762332 RepID=UPI0016396A7B|nr:hypothetical protein [Robiginitalea sp. SC105]MBC2837850.1 hypothetical protein [Robiginitalea sp. SC105]